MTARRPLETNGTIQLPAGSGSPYALPRAVATEEAGDVTGNGVRVVEPRRVSGAIDELQLAAGQHVGDAPPELDAPHWVGGPVDHERWLLDRRQLGVREGELGPQPRAPAHNGTHHVALVAQRVGLPLERDPPPEVLRGDASGVQARAMSGVTHERLHPALLRWEPDHDRAERRRDQLDRPRGAGLGDDRPSAHEDDAARPLRVPRREGQG